MAYYPPVGFHFRVNFALSGLTGNDAEASFQEVSGLTQEMGLEEVKEGGENRFSHRLPTRSSFQKLVLKRGMLADSQLIDWFKQSVEDYDINPVDVQVMLLNADSDPIATWSFVRAWPVKWDVSGFNAQESSIVAETIELSYQYFTRII